MSLIEVVPRCLRWVKGVSDASSPYRLIPSRIIIIDFFSDRISGGEEQNSVVFPPLVGGDYLVSFVFFRAIG